MGAMDLLTLKNATSIQSSTLDKIDDAAVADIGLAQPLLLAAPVIGVAGKDKFIIQKNALAMLRIVPRMLPTIYRSGLIHRKI